MNRKTKKITALLTFLAFTLSHLNLSSQGLAAALTYFPSEVVLNQPGLQLSLPAELGVIQSQKSGRGPTLIHIQTAHGQYEAQKKIEKILEYLKYQYGFKTLLVEGSPFKLQPEFVRFFPDDKKLTLKIADRLTQKALLKAAELFLIKEKNVQAYGIEDLEAYRKNVESFRKVLTQKAKSEKFLLEMDRQIHLLSSPYLNKDLRIFLNRLEDFENQKIPFLNQLSFLKENARKILSKDLNDPDFQMDWPMLFRIFKLREMEVRLDKQALPKEREQFLRKLKPTLPSKMYERIKALLEESVSDNQLPDPETGLLFEKMALALPAGFKAAAYPNVRILIGYLILQSELKAERLAEETELLSNRIAAKLAVTAEEKMLLSLFKDYRLLKRLLSLQLTPADYELVLTRGENLLPEKITQRFLDINRADRVRSAQIENKGLHSLFEKALEFYKQASARDQIMISQVESRLKKIGVDKAIVITGGFHSEPFKKYFEGHGYSYALITPKISSLEGNGAYIESILQSKFQKSTLESISQALPYQKIQAAGFDPLYFTTSFAAETASATHWKSLQALESRLRQTLQVSQYEKEKGNAVFKWEKKSQNRINAKIFFEMAGRFEMRSTESFEGVEILQQGNSKFNEIFPGNLFGGEAALHALEQMGEYAKSLSETKPLRHLLVRVYRNPEEAAAWKEIGFESLPFAQQLRAHFEKYPPLIDKIAVGKDFATVPLSQPVPGFEEHKTLRFWPLPSDQEFRWAIEKVNKRQNRASKQEFFSLLMSRFAAGSLEEDVFSNVLGFQTDERKNEFASFSGSEKLAEVLLSEEGFEKFLDGQKKKEIEQAEQKRRQELVQLRSEEEPSIVPETEKLLALLEERSALPDAPMTPTEKKDLIEMIGQLKTIPDRVIASQGMLALDVIREAIRKQVKEEVARFERIIIVKTTAVVNHVIDRPLFPGLDRAVAENWLIRTAAVLLGKEVADREQAILAFSYYPGIFPRLERRMERLRRFLRLNTPYVVAQNDVRLILLSAVTNERGGVAQGNSAVARKNFEDALDSFELLSQTLAARIHEREDAAGMDFGITKEELNEIGRELIRGLSDPDSVHLKKVRLSYEFSKMFLDETIEPKSKSEKLANFLNAVSAEDFEEAVRIFMSFSNSFFQPDRAVRTAWGGWKKVKEYYEILEETKQLVLPAMREEIDELYEGRRAALDEYSLEEFSRTLPRRITEFEKLADLKDLDKAMEGALKLYYLFQRVAMSRQQKQSVETAMKKLEARVGAVEINPAAKSAAADSRAELRSENPDPNEQAQQESFQRLQSLNQYGILSPFLQAQLNLPIHGSTDYAVKGSSTPNARISFNTFNPLRHGREFDELKTAYDEMIRKALYDPAMGMLQVVMERPWDERIKLMHMPEKQMQELLSERARHTAIFLADRDLLAEENKESIPRYSNQDDPLKTMEVFLSHPVRPAIVIVSENLGLPVDQIFNHGEEIITVKNETTEEIEISRRNPRQGWESKLIRINVPDVLSALNEVSKKYPEKQWLLHAIRLVAPSDLSARSAEPRAELRVFDEAVSAMTHVFSEPPADETILLPTRYPMDVIHVMDFILNQHSILFKPLPREGFEEILSEIHVALKNQWLTGYSPKYRSFIFIRALRAVRAARPYLEDLSSRESVDILREMELTETDWLPPIGWYRYDVYSEWLKDLTHGAYFFIDPRQMEVDSRAFHKTINIILNGEEQPLDHNSITREEFDRLRHELIGLLRPFHLEPSLNWEHWAIVGALGSGGLSVASAVLHLPEAFMVAGVTGAVGSLGAFAYGRMFSLLSQYIRGSEVMRAATAKDLLRKFAQDHKSTEGGRSELRQPSDEGSTGNKLQRQKPILPAQVNSLEHGVPNYARRLELRSQPISPEEPQLPKISSEAAMRAIETFRREIKNSHVTQDEFEGFNEMLSVFFKQIPEIENLPISSTGLFDARTPDLLKRTLEQAGLLLANLSRKDPELASIETIFLEAVEEVFAYYDWKAHSVKNRKERLSFYQLALGAILAAHKIKPASVSIKADLGITYFHLDKLERAESLLFSLINQNGQNGNENGAAHGNGTNGDTYYFRAAKVTLGYIRLKEAQFKYNHFSKSKLLQRDPSAAKDKLETIIALAEEAGTFFRAVISEYYRSGEKNMGQIPRSYAGLAGILQLLHIVYLRFAEIESLNGSKNKNLILASLEYSAKALDTASEGLILSLHRTSSYKHSKDFYENILRDIAEGYRNGIQNSALQEISERGVYDFSSSEILRLRHALESFTNNLAGRTTQRRIYQRPLPEDDLRVLNVKRFIERVEKDFDFIALFQKRAASSAKELLPVHKYRTTQDFINELKVLTVEKMKAEEPLSFYLSSADEVAAKALQYFDSIAEEWSKLDLADLYLLKWGIETQKGKEKITEKEFPELQQYASLDLKEALPEQEELSQTDIIARFEKQPYVLLGLKIKISPIEQQKPVAVVSKPKVVEKGSRRLDVFNDRDLERYIQKDSRRTAELKKIVSGISPWMKKERAEQLESLMLEIEKGVQLFLTESKKFQEDREARKSRSAKPLDPQVLRALLESMRTARTGTATLEGYLPRMERLERLLENDSAFIHGYISGITQKRPEEFSLHEKEREINKRVFSDLMNLQSALGYPIVTQAQVVAGDRYGRNGLRQNLEGIQTFYNHMGFKWLKADILELKEIDASLSSESENYFSREKYFSLIEAAAVILIRVQTYRFRNQRNLELIEKNEVELQGKMSWIEEKVAMLKDFPFFQTFVNEIKVRHQKIKKALAEEIPRRSDYSRNALLYQKMMARITGLLEKADRISEIMTKLLQWTKIATQMQKDYENHFVDPPEWLSPSQRAFSMLSELKNQLKALQEIPVEYEQLDAFQEKIEAADMKISLTLSSLGPALREMQAQKKTNLDKQLKDLQKIFESIQTKAVVGMFPRAISEKTGAAQAMQRSFRKTHQLLKSLTETGHETATPSANSSMQIYAQFSDLSQAMDNALQGEISDQKASIFTQTAASIKKRFDSELTRIGRETGEKHSLLVKDTLEFFRLSMDLKVVYGLYGYPLRYKLESKNPKALLDIEGINQQRVRESFEVFNKDISNPFERWESFDNAQSIFAYRHFLMSLAAATAYYERMGQNNGGMTIPDAKGLLKMAFEDAFQVQEKNTSSDEERKILNVIKELAGKEWEAMLKELPEPKSYSLEPQPEKFLKEIFNNYSGVILKAVNRSELRSDTALPKLFYQIFSKWELEKIKTLDERTPREIFVDTGMSKLSKIMKGKYVLKQASKEQTRQYLDNEWKIMQKILEDVRHKIGQEAKKGVYSPYYFRVGTWNPLLEGIIMPYYEGKNGYDYYMNQGSTHFRSAEEYLKTVLQMMDGVSYLNRLAIVHRDIKPDNFFVTPEGPILIDFNLAYILGESKETLNGGTPGYASPQQWSRETPTLQDDVFSIGVTLAVLWQGYKPPEEEMTMISKSRLSNIVQTRFDLSTNPLKNVIIKATEVDPKKRYHTVEEIAREIRKLYPALPPPLYDGFGVRQELRMNAVPELLGSGDGFGVRREADASRTEKTSETGSFGIRQELRADENYQQPTGKILSATVISLNEHPSRENTKKFELRRSFENLFLLASLSWIIGPAEGVLAYVSILIHEMGHYLPAKILQIWRKWEGRSLIRRVFIRPILLVTEIRADHELSFSPTEQIIFQLGGPMANLITAAIAFVFIFNVPEQWQSFFVKINLFNFFVNILFGYDGEKIKRLWEKGKVVKEMEAFYPIASFVESIRVVSSSSYLVRTQNSVYGIYESTNAPEIKKFEYAAPEIKDGVWISVTGRLIKNLTGQSYFSVGDKNYALYEIENFPDALLPPRPAPARFELRKPVTEAKVETVLEFTRSELRLDIKPMNESELRAYVSTTEWRNFFRDFREQSLPVRFEEYSAGFLVEILSELLGRTVYSENAGILPVMPESTIARIFEKQKANITPDGAHWLESSFSEQGKVILDPLWLDKLISKSPSTLFVLLKALQKFQVEKGIEKPSIAVPGTKEILDKISAALQRKNNGLSAEEKQALDYKNLGKLIQIIPENTLSDYIQSNHYGVAVLLDPSHREKFSLGAQFILSPDQVPDEDLMAVAFLIPSLLKAARLVYGLRDSLLQRNELQSHIQDILPGARLDHGSFVIEIAQYIQGILIQQHLIEAAA